MPTTDKYFDVAVDYTILMGYLKSRMRQHIAHLKTISGTQAVVREMESDLLKVTEQQKSITNKITEDEKAN